MYIYAYIYLHMYTQIYTVDQRGIDECLSKPDNTYDMHAFSVYKYMYRVAKTHTIPYLYRSFSTKVTYI